MCQNEKSQGKSKSKQHQGKFGKLSLEGLWKQTQQLDWKLGNPELGDRRGGDPENTGLPSGSQQGSKYQGRLPRLFCIFYLCIILW